MTFRKVLRTRHKGFTLIELLVVIAIIAILIALLVPAVQKVRDAAARTQSTNNLKNIALAFHGFHDVLKKLPFNGLASTGTSTAPQNGSWAYQILPYIDQVPMYNYTTLPTFAAPAYLCPGRSRSNALPWSDYFINLYLNGSGAAPAGVAAIDAGRTMVSITDGTSNTVFVGHGSINIPYPAAVGAMSGSIFSGGTGATARGTTVVNRVDSTATTVDWGGPFPQGAIMGMGDGTVRVFPYTAPYNSIGAFLTTSNNEAATLPDV